jgi:flagellar biosynthetic protein FliR
VKFSIDTAAMTAFVLVLVRTSVFVFFAPPFNTRAIPTTVKAGLAAALSLAIAPTVPPSSLSLDTGPFIGAIVTQAVVGLAMALTMLLLMTAVQSAGALIDVFAGFSLAALYDPLSENTTSVFGRFYQLLATTLLFASNGHLLIMRGFIASFQAVPAATYDPAVMAQMLTLNFGKLFVAALEIAGPVIACLFLAELVMGLLARAAPSLNVFALAFPVRVGVTLLVVALAIPLVAPAVSNLVNEGARAMVGGG